MPIYEYELEFDDCLICSGRFEALQSIGEDPLKYCPTCGLPVKRVVSSAQFKVKVDASADRAAKKGLTTYKKSQEGVWEKVGGPGVDVIVGSEEDKKRIASEKKPKEVIDLDKADP